ncbi:uncharacterized protein LOC128293197 isoform X1 [Gossypium arboreum]|uniref:uncharacterized protein LOC128293192 isoform X1 n=1 Tax=Gossypium arboreum TaxID=29729 RepID=UPI0022F18962|nr:uncharacterized protein LOC128293192 isoform X1 [Gossypium arboreum]XP_052884798.1 uncharacterized protein LOC128293192 isoform X1 [Gossypium arboreum]XP_052884815.1 uncharacterized protein LOC128293197 isoform X1 [Gossypium arboreum]
MLLPSLHIVQEGGSVRNVVRILHGRRQECKWAILCGVSCTYSSANPNENVLISFKLPQQQVFNFDLGFCMKKNPSGLLLGVSCTYIVRRLEGKFYRMFYAFYSWLHK